jgi:hypothetical protein
MRNQQAGDAQGELTPHVGRLHFGIRVSIYIVFVLGHFVSLLCSVLFFPKLLSRVVTLMLTHRDSHKLRGGLRPKPSFARSLRTLIATACLRSVKPISLILGWAAMRSSLVNKNIGSLHSGYYFLDGVFENGFFAPLAHCKILTSCVDFIYDVHVPTYCDV